MMCAKRPPPPPQFLLPRGCAAPTVRFSTSRHVAHDAESGHPDISRPLIRYMITARQPVRFRLPEQYRLPAARPSDDGFVPPNGTVGQWRPNAESGRPDTPPDEPRPLIRSASRPRPPKLAAGLSDHNSFLPPNDGVRKWLVDAEMASASASASSNAPSPAAGAPDDMAASNADESNGHTVLVLNAASKNLAETDFYRIARQGRHVDGWATGLVKVVQARESVTHEPLGQYFLFFELRSAALQYLEDARRLHQQAWSALPVEWRTSPHRQNTQQGARPHLKPPADTDAAQAFTLLVQDGTLRLHAYSAEWLRKELSIFMVEQYREGVIASRLPSGQAADENESVWFGISDLVDPVSDVFAPLGHHEADDLRDRVLLHLEGCAMTGTMLRDLLAADGRRRNLPWALATTATAVDPVRITQLMPKSSMLNDLDKEAGWEGLSEGEGEGEGTGKYMGGADRGETTSPEYTRFVLTFASPLEGRRFVRQWHKRTMRDRRTGRIVVINARALW